MNVWLKYTTVVQDFSILMGFMGFSSAAVAEPVAQQTF